MTINLMNLDCSGVTTENSAICVFFFIYGVSVVLVTLVTLTNPFLSNMVDIEWRTSKVSVFLNFFQWCHSPCCVPFRWISTNAVIVFVVLAGFVGVSSVRTDWGFALVSLAAVLTCTVNCGKCIRTRVVSMTTLLCLMNCNLIIGSIKFLIATTFSAELLSPVSNLDKAFASGFS